MACCEPTIRMERPHLRDIPPVILPAGYEMRNAWPDFEDAWVSLLNAAFEETYTVEGFHRDFVVQEHFDPESFFFVFHGEEPVATAFAWLDTPQERVWGHVHWVAVRNEHRGRGLARAVVASALLYHARCGLQKAFLTTQGFRLPAICLYLSLDFEPSPQNEEEERIWSEVNTALRLQPQE